MAFGNQPAVFGEFVLDACRNRNVIGLESPAKLDGESVIRVAAVIGIEKAYSLTSLAPDHRRLQTHQKSPAQVLKDVTAVVKHVLVRRALDYRSTPFADRLARLISAQIDVLLAGRQVEESRADLASHSGIIFLDLHAVMVNDAPPAEVFPKLICDELLFGKRA